MIDFYQIKGPMSSKQDDFQELCSELVLREYPEAKPVEGIGGDAGLDIYEGISPSKPKVIWQAKLFYNPLRQAQKRQIFDSFKKVVDLPGLKKWILCLPRNLNPHEQEWLQSLRTPAKGVSPVFIDWWGETKLRELLLRHPDIAMEFFPGLTEQPPEKSLILHNLSIGNTDIEFMLTNLSNNLIIVDSICIEVLRWGKYNKGPTIGARIVTYKYEVSLKPNFTGEILINTPKFKYARGDVDNFTISFLSPPGNEYVTRLNFHCSDALTGRKFIVSSSEFELRFYKPGGKRGNLIIVE